MPGDLRLFLAAREPVRMVLLVLAGAAALSLSLAGGAVSAAPNGLVAAYGFNEGAGTTTADASGGGNTGTVSGATWSTTGKFGKALAFASGRSAHVRIADSAALHLTTGMTLEAWMNPSTNGGSWRTVVFKERPGGMTYALYGHNGSRPVGQIFTNAEKDALGTAALATNTWTHLATTYDGTALKLFRNGVQVSSVAVTGSIISSTGLLKIGGNAVWSEWFVGQIDEVRVYNRALSASEIQTDMATPVAPPTQDTTPPSTPTNLAMTSRTTSSISFAWTASNDDTGVTGYDLYKNSAAAGTAPGTSATFSNLTCGTAYTIGVAAFDQAGNRSPQTSISASTVACDTTAPTVQITAPAQGSTVSQTVDVTATAADNTAVVGVQFKLDGQNLGAEDTAAPYRVSWDTTSAAPGSHTLAAVARDPSANTGNASPVGVTVDNGSQPSFVLDTLVTGLAEPTQILFTPDGRMLILERAGTVRVVQPGSNQPDATPLLQLSSVETSDERGALGLVLDPAFDANGFIYVMYTHSSLVNRVSRFTVVGESAPLSSERVIWQNDVAAAIYHQGGGLWFGADGTLFISVGDNLSAASAQSLTSYNGKILRIGADGSIPADNPFHDGAGPNRDEIWALGLRNPFRLSIDGQSGRMLIGDVGEVSWEEVNLGARGVNYGWPTCEGNCSSPGMTNPIHVYGHSNHDASITGGFVYRGGGFGPGYDGSYFFADYAQNWIRRLTFDAGGNVTGQQNFLPADGTLDGPYGDPVDLRQGPDGALYYVDIGPLSVANSGAIRRIRNVNGNQPPSVSSSALPRSGRPPLSVSFSSFGTSDPESDPLTFSWDFGDGTSSTDANPTHVYAASGSYQARLSVSDGQNTAFAIPIQIQVGTPPVPHISSPADGLSFQAGQSIAFTGSASDAEDGTVAPNRLDWTVVFHHETHMHPGPGPFTGTSGSFNVPTSGHDFSGNTSYELVLTATDSTDLSASTSVFVHPSKVNLTFGASPSGLNVLVDSLPHATPYVVDSLIGFHHVIDAPSPQSFSGSAYAFSSWSDGGAQSHEIVVPSSAQTYTATYTASANIGLVAAYGFEEGTGTTLTDLSGRGNNGTIANATWSTTGKHGKALTFNGSNSLVTVADSSSLDLTTGMTLEAWVNPTALGIWRTVIFKERPGGMNYSLYANDDVARPVGQLWLQNAEQNARGASSVPLNAWTHLAATYDGSTLRMYVGGTQTSSLAVSGTLANTANALRIGGNTVWGEYFRGLIDDVRIYNRALSPGELANDMAAGVG